MGGHAPDHGWLNPPSQCNGLRCAPDTINSFPEPMDSQCSDHRTERGLLPVGDQQKIGKVICTQALSPPGGETIHRANAKD